MSPATGWHPNPFLSHDAAVALAEHLHEVDHRQARTASQPWSRLPERTREYKILKARTALAAVAAAGLADREVWQDDDERFCSKCFAGVESDEHREKCGASDD